MRRSTIGGQAVMEGVMMRAPHSVALSVRRANGEIESDVKPFIPMNERRKILGWPIIRGVVNFVDMLSLGMRTLTQSADILMQDEMEAIRAEESQGGTPSPLETPPASAQHDSDSCVKNRHHAADFSEATEGLQAEKSAEPDTDGAESGQTAEAGPRNGSGNLPPDGAESGQNTEQVPRNDSGSCPPQAPKEKKKQEPMMVVAMILAVALALGLFFVLPTLVANWIRPNVQSVFLMNLVEGGIRLTIFILYLLAVSAMKDIRRVFAYHGAEHKVVDCYEKELPLEVENARGCSRLHPRCGTNYLFLVMMVSILVFSLMGWSGHPLLRVVIRLLMLPVVAGLAYEVLRLAARSDNILARIIRAPGLFLQRITTREPDDGMIEVALTAFNLALRQEEKQQAEAEAAEA